jgi:hypothetical protein
MNSQIDFQYNTVNEFIKQVLGGYILMSIEENYSELNNLYINIKEWITMSFELNFNYKNNEKLKQITKDLFDQIIYLRLTGKLTGILSSVEFIKV